MHEDLTYLHTYLLFPDIARVQNVDVKMEVPFVLKRFVPRNNDVLEEQLDLSQFEVVILNSMDMCVRFQTEVLQVSGQPVGIWSSVLLKYRSVMKMGSHKCFLYGNPFCDGCSIYKYTWVLFWTVSLM
jgi:hypothetical protein